MHSGIQEFSRVTRDLHQLHEGREKREKILSPSLLILVCLELKFHGYTNASCKSFTGCDTYVFGVSPHAKPRASLGEERGGGERNGAIRKQDETRRYILYAVIGIESAEFSHGEEAGGQRAYVMLVVVASLVFISCRGATRTRSRLGCTRGAPNTMECRVHGSIAFESYQRALGLRQLIHRRHVRLVKRKKERGRKEEKLILAIKYVKNNTSLQPIILNQTRCFL